MIVYDKNIEEMYSLDIQTQISYILSPFIIYYSDDTDLFFYFTGEFFLRNFTIASLVDYSYYCS